MEIKLKGRKIYAGKATGAALVCHEPICFLGGVDVKRGIITEVGHELEGQSIKDKVLIFPTGKGSTGGSYLMYESIYNKVGPCAILNRNIEQVTAIGAIISEIPTMDSFDIDPVDTIKTGEIVEVDADNGIVTIKRED